VPIHKKGDRHLVDNYCPITLTSIIGKVLESIIKDHILNHFTDNDLFTPYQHAWKLLCTQLLYVMELWTKSLDLGYPVDVIYFGRFLIQYHMLLLKLQAYGIRGNLLMK